MALLPFPLDCTLFFPLQPEDSAMEEWRRNQPQYAEYYTTVSDLLMAAAENGAPVARPAPGAAPGGPNVQAESAYALWQHTCREMAAEVGAARQAWKEAVALRDATYAQLHADAEHLRAKLRSLEARPKPPQPRSSKKAAQ